MTPGSRASSGIAIVLLAAAGAFALTYLAIGKEMNIIVQALAAVFILFLGFTSVKLSLILLSFSMLLSPEIMVGSTAKRDITLRLEDMILLTMTLGWVIRMAVRKDIGIFIRTPLNRSIAIYSAIAILATAFGAFRGTVNPSSGFFFTLKLIEFFILFAILVNYLGGMEDVNTILTVHLLTFGIVILYALIQAVLGGDVSAPFEGEAGERNTLGGYIVLMGSVACGILLHSDSRVEKQQMLVLICFAIVVLLVSLSRSGWLSAVVSMAILFASARQKNIFLLVIALAFLALPLISPDMVRDRLMYTWAQPLETQIQYTIFGIRLDTSTSARLESALMVFQNIGHSPILGFGITGYRFLDGHFLRVLIETGLLGLGSFIVLLTGVHQTIHRTARLDLSPRLRGMVIGFGAGFWGMMVHALTANTFMIVRIAEPFWCLAGLTTYCLMHHHEEEEQTEMAQARGVR